MVKVYLHTLMVTFTKVYFYKGMYHGKGIFTWDDGESYDGDWKNDMYHGTGVLTYDNGIYKGEFVNNNMEGKGVLMYKDGSIYDGEFLNNKINGFGIYTYCNGKIDVGDWEDGDKITRWSIYMEDIVRLATVRVMRQQADVVKSTLTNSQMSNPQVEDKIEDKKVTNNIVRYECMYCKQQDTKVIASSNDDVDKDNFIILPKNDKIILPQDEFVLV